MSSSNAPTIVVASSCESEDDRLQQGVKRVGSLKFGTRERVVMRLYSALVAPWELFMPWVTKPRIVRPC